jgi:hypothetical protein
VRLTIASIAGRGRNEHCDALAAEFVKRTSGFLPIETELFRTAEAFFEMFGKQRSRLAATLVLLDSGWKEFSSEELERWLGTAVPERTLRQFGATLTRLRAAGEATQIEKSA